MFKLRSKSTNISFAGIKKDDVVAFLLIFSAVVFIYMGMLSYPFIWDDSISITDNPGFGTLTYIKDLFTGHFFDAGLPYSFGTDTGFYRPLVGVSFVLDKMIWGMNAYGFRLTNIMLHIFTAYLFYFFMKRIKFNFYYALIGALIYAIHPIHIGSVAYISGRTDVLRTFFMLLAIFSYRDKKNVTSLVFFAFSLLTKEDAVVLPGVLLGLDVIINKKLSKSVVWFILLSAIYMIMRRYYLNFSDIRSLDINICFLGTLAASLLEYLRIIIFPYDLHFERFFPVIKSVPIAIAFIVMTVLFILLIINRNKHDRRAMFSLFSFAVIFFPVSNFFPIYNQYRYFYIFLADHFMYFPMMFLIILFACIVERLNSAVTKYGYKMILVILAISFLVFHFKYSKSWINSEMLYTHIEEESEFPFRAYNNLAAYYAEKGDPRCLQYLEKLRRIMPPDYTTYYITKANWHYFKEKNIDESIKTLNDAINNGVRNSSVYFPLGDMYFEVNDIREAVKTYELGISVTKSENYIIFFRLGFFYTKLGDIENLKKAEKWFEESLIINPENMDITKYLYNTRKKIYDESHPKIKELEHIFKKKVN